MSVAVTLFCDCPIAQGDFPGVSEGNRSVGITIESIRNGVLSRVPSLSLYEFRLFFSLYSQRKYTRWGGKHSQVFRNRVHCSQKAQNAGNSQIQQDVSKRAERERERARERLRQAERVNVYVLVFRGDLSLSLIQLVLILFPETVPCWEKFPAPFLIHLPDIRFLEK